MKQQEISQDLKAEAEGSRNINNPREAGLMASRSPLTKENRVLSATKLKDPEVVLARNLACLTVQIVSVSVAFDSQPSARPASNMVILVCLFFNYYGLNQVLLQRFQIGRTRIYDKGFQAGSFIVKAYLILLRVNANYISLIIIPIIMLAFIVALCRQISVNGSLKSDHDNDAIQAEKTDDYGACSAHVNFVGDADDSKDKTIRVAIVQCFEQFISIMLVQFQFHGDNFLVVSQFFVFLSLTLWALTWMLERLQSSEVAPALDVLRKAYLVVVLLSAHTVAVELLGEDVVLAFIPELVAVLLWFSSHLGHGGTTVITIDKATSLQANVIVSLLGAVLMAFLAYTAPSIEESDGGLLPQYKTAVFACAVSLILLSVCAFALRQWPAVPDTKDTPTNDAPTKDAPSLDLEGAIRLFNFWKKHVSITIALLLILPLVHARLRLQVQGLVADKVRLWKV